MTHPGVGPTLRAKDAPALPRFLNEVVGFEASLITPSNEGSLPMELRDPEGNLWIAGTYRGA